MEEVVQTVPGRKGEPDGDCVDELGDVVRPIVVRL